MSKKKRRLSNPSPRLRKGPAPAAPLNHWSPAKLEGEAAAYRRELQKARLGGLTLNELPPEIRNMTTDVRFQPWRVTLWIQDNQFSIKLRPVTYFVRGPEAEHCIMAVAAPLWMKWERKDAGIEDHVAYPCIADGVHMPAVVIDEQDWMEYLRDARKYGAPKGLQMHFVGDPRHPTFWTVPGMVFDVEGYETMCLNPHAAYDRSPTAISNDENTPDWDLKPADARPLE